MKKMTKLQEFDYNVKFKTFLYREMNEAERLEDWDKYFECKNVREKLEADYFEKLPKVAVKFWIGYRQYFHEVIKLGKAYYDHSGTTKMNKSRGYRSIEEIPVITGKMTEEMIADSYYY